MKNVCALVSAEFRYPICEAFAQSLTGKPSELNLSQLCKQAL